MQHRPAILTDPARQPPGFVESLWATVQHPGMYHAGLILLSRVGGRYMECEVETACTGIGHGTLFCSVMD